ncbi:hypothetical protein JCM8547_007139 [Rhodosporidiobolus lusitaniae]
MHFSFAALLPLALTLSSSLAEARTHPERLAKRCDDHSSTTVSSFASSSTSSAAAVATSSTSIKASTDVFGFASLNGGTTGGAGGSETTVSDLDTLRDAVEGDDAAIIYIDGIITGDGETVKVGSNKSILPANGGGADGLTGGGLMVKEASNVIIQGLSFSKSPAPTDLVAIQESTNVFVAYNTFASDLDHDKDYYDGQLDITHAGDYITVAWNVFKDAYKTSLIGHSDSNGDEDEGHLRVTYAYNHFTNVNSRLPSIRFSAAAHIYYYDSVLSSGINSRQGAEVLIESNYFEDASNPIMSSEEGGYVVVNDDNIYVDSEDPDLSNVGTISSSDLGYSYSLEAGADVPALVVAGAGAEKYSA